MDTLRTFGLLSGTAASGTGKIGSFFGRAFAFGRLVNLAAFASTFASSVTVFRRFDSCGATTSSTGCCFGGRPLRFGAGTPFSSYGIVVAADATLRALDRLLGGMFSGCSTVFATDELLARAFGFGTTATGGSIDSSSLALFGGRPLGAGIGFGLSSPERHGIAGVREVARLRGCAFALGFGGGVSILW